jgi:hypothetical protein
MGGGSVPLSKSPFVYTKGSFATPSAGTTAATHNHRSAPRNAPTTTRPFNLFPPPRTPHTAAPQRPNNHTTFQSVPAAPHPAAPHNPNAQLPQKSETPFRIRYNHKYGK